MRPHRLLLYRRRRVLEDYMTADVAGMQMFRTNKQLGFKAIVELTRQKDPVILERTYDTYSKRHEAVDGQPLPCQAGIETMITGFHDTSIHEESRTAMPPVLSIHLSCRKPSND